MSDSSLFSPFLCQDVVRIICSNLPPSEIAAILETETKPRAAEILDYCIARNPDGWYEYAMARAGDISETTFYSYLHPNVTQVKIDMHTFPAHYNSRRYITWVKTLRLAHIEAANWFYAIVGLRAVHATIRTTDYTVECNSATVYNYMAVLPENVKHVDTKYSMIKQQKCRPEHVIQPGYDLSLITSELKSLRINTKSSSGSAEFLRRVYNMAPDCHVTLIVSEYHTEDLVAPAGALTTNMPMPITDPRIKHDNTPCQLFRVDFDIAMTRSFNFLRLSTGGVIVLD